MRSSPLDCVLAAACGLLLLGHHGHSAPAAATAASVRALCAQPQPATLRSFCNWLYSSPETAIFRREPTYKIARRLGDDGVFETEPLVRNGRSDARSTDLELQPELESPSLLPRPERYLQEPSAWETIKRQDNNHMFLRFGRRRK